MDRLGGTFGSHDDANEYEDLHVEDGSDEGAHDGAPLSPVGQDERRMQVRAYNHWASLLGDRNFPAIGELNPAGLPDFGPYSVLLDFSAGMEDPGILFLGRELAGECDASGRISRLSDVPSRSLLSRITDHYMQILANQAPIGFEAEFVNQRGHTALYRGILLPYSSDNETIDFIYGVINWKELADQATADELLLEIDQALERDSAAEGHLDAEDDGEESILDLAGDWAEEEDDVLDLGTDDFAASEEDEITGFGEEIEARPADTHALEETGLSGEIDWDAADLPLKRRDEPASFAEGFDDDSEEPDYSVDYGENSLDDEAEGEGDDVDDLVDPLADESVGSGLSALVSRGSRRKPIVELPIAAPFGNDGGDETGPAMPQAYEPETPPPTFQRAPVTMPEPEEVEAYEFVPAAAETQEWDEPGDDIGEVESDMSFVADESGDCEAQTEVEDSTDVDSSPATRPADAAEALHDVLAEAREMALVARSSEDRTRSALYQAVGRAYDFSLEAHANPDEFAELVADNGLSVQERAPMTPVVKLVFGAEYDKTRITEYAAVLSHAHRLGVARGGLATVLREAVGGLKGIVEAERRARKEETGKPVEPADGIKLALARKLRKLEPVDFEDLSGDGPEFALLMVRRTPAGELVVLGEIPDDAKLVERAGHKLVA